MDDGHPLQQSQLRDLSGLLRRPHLLFENLGGPSVTTGSYLGTTTERQPKAETDQVLHHANLREVPRTHHQRLWLVRKDTTHH